MHELSYKGRPVAILALIAALCAPTVLRAQKEKKSPGVRSPFSLTVSSEASTVKTGEPVWVVVVLGNQSDHEIPVYKAWSDDADQGGWVYKVEVQDDKGTTVPETTFYRHRQGHLTAEEDAKGGVMVMRSGSLIFLKPGKTITDKVNVSKLSDLSRPGKYRIQFQRFDPESKTFVKSNAIAVAVVP